MQNCLSFKSFAFFRFTCFSYWLNTLNILTENWTDRDQSRRKTAEWWKLLLWALVQNVLVKESASWQRKWMGKEEDFGAAEGEPECLVKLIPRKVN